MKKILMAVVAVVLVATTGAAWAAQTSVAVSATVVGTCRFNNTGVVAFGTLDQVNAPLVNGVVTQPEFWCTKNANYTITDDSGANESGPGSYRMTNGTDFIGYTFSYTAAGAGSGKTSPITMNIAATVPAGTYSDVSEGSYTDTVTLTIIP